MMRFVVVTELERVAALNEQFRATIAAVSEAPRRQRIGTAGGTLEADVYWSPRHQFWMCFERLPHRECYWNSCGLGDPFIRVPAPTVELNYPWEGRGREAGLLLDDGRGNVYLGHTGGVRGGRPGVSRTNFLRFDRAWTTVELDGEGEERVYLLGRIDAPNLPESVLAFTRAVAGFKAAIAAQDPVALGQAQLPDPMVPTVPDFAPEFEGDMTYTRPEDAVTAHNHHGRVVRELREQLRVRGIVAGNTDALDLYVLAQGRTDRFRALFEVKTLSTTSAIYAAVGQLEFHGGAGRSEHLVAVLPVDLRGQHARRLGELGITVLAFELQEAGGVRFPRLDEVAAALAA